MKFELKSSFKSLAACVCARRDCVEALLDIQDVFKWNEICTQIKFYRSCFLWHILRQSDERVGRKKFPSVTFQARQQSAKQTKAGKLFSLLLFSHLFDVQLFTRFLSFIRCCFSYLFIATYVIPVGVMCCCRAPVYEMRRDWQVEAWMTLHLLPMFNAEWHLFAQRWKSFHTQTLSSTST